MTGPIVVGVDGSEASLAAVRWAGAEAAARRVPLRLVHGYDLPVRSYPQVILAGHDLRAALEYQGGRWLEQAREEVGCRVPAGSGEFATRRGESRATRSAPNSAAPAEGGGGSAGIEVPETGSPDSEPPGTGPLAPESVGTELVSAGAVEALVAQSRRARVVVLGARGGGGFGEALAGSTAVAVAAHARCPVVVVRGTEAPDGPVVVGVDGSPASEDAIAFAFEEASRWGAPLRAVIAWSEFTAGGLRGPGPLELDRLLVDDQARRLLAQRLAGWREEYPDVAVERVVVHDRPVRALLRLAGGARLLVVGSRGHGGFTGMLLGSTSQALVYHSPCPLAVVRPVGRGEDERG